MTSIEDLEFAVKCREDWRRTLANWLAVCRGERTNLTAGFDPLWYKSEMVLALHKETGYVAGLAFKWAEFVYDQCEHV